MKVPSPTRCLLLAFLLLSFNCIALAQDPQNPEVPVDKNSGLPENAPKVDPTPPSGDPQEVSEAPLALPADIDPNSSLAQSSQFQRWWSSYSIRTNVTGGAPGDLQTGPILTAVGAMNSNVGIPPSGGVPGNRWVGVGARPMIAGQVGRFLGTRDMSGRVTTIAVDPSNASHWMIGGAQGGVWETIDAGQNWVAKTDNAASLAMGAIAFAPSNPRVIYAGTGEAAFSGDGYFGRGLLKTTDGGTNWTLLAKPTFDKTTFARIRVNPTNANMVWAAIAFGTSGRASTTGTPSVPPRGILKSTDGGNTWAMKLPATAASDIVLKPGDTTASKMYAGLGYVNGAAENGIYRSTDQGETFALVTGPWTGDPRGVGRIQLAMSPANPNVLYVSIQDAFGGTGVDGGLLGLYKTSNAWDPVPVFTLINTSATEVNTVTPGSPGTGSGYCGWDYAFSSASNQCWYSHEIAADPTDANIVYAGGIPLWRFNGNTSTWTEISKTGDANLSNGFVNSIHVDQHAIAFAGTRMIVGNDGGVWSSTDRGDTFADHNTNLSISQYYDGAISQGNETFPGNNNFDPGPGLMLAGAQDNGYHLYFGDQAWGWVGGGDGVDSAISPTNPTTRWAWNSQGNSIRRTFNSGTSSSAATAGLASSRPFVGRFEECLTNENIFIAATNVDLYRNTGFFNPTFAAWVVNPVIIGTTHFTFGSGINAFGFARSDATCNTYAFNSVGSGNLWLTQSAGAVAGAGWKDLRVGNPLLPARTVTDYAFDPANGNNLYMTFSGFDENTPSTPGHLFKSSNALSASPTFTNITPPVNVPFNTVVVDPVNSNVVYVGTDVGVWRSTNAGGSWIQMGDNNSGMPNVAVFELQISPVKVAAFTHGRGAFILGGYDLNGDNAVNCADVSIVTASMGKRIGQPGYNPAADLNNDNQVNVRDLAMLTKQLPSGTTCP